MILSDATPYRSTLESSVAFKGLESAALDRVIAQGLPLDAKTDDLVFFENMRGGLGLYTVLTGSVQIFRSSGDGEIHLSTLEPGQCFGEYSLMDGLNASASARARDNCKLFLLPRGAIQEIADSNPVAGKIIYKNLLLHLIERLRKIEH
jgi:CRP-like cAMP-binding protein